MMQINGIGASSGVAVGTAYKLMKEEVRVDVGRIEADAVAGELCKLDTALEQVKIQMEAIIQAAVSKMGDEDGALFEAQCMVLEDTVFLGEIRDCIAKQQITAAEAVTQVIGKYVALYSRMESAYQRERATDIQDIGDRLVRNLLGVAESCVLQLPPDTVLFADVLTPTDTLSLDKSRLAGFVTRTGGKTSHVAIIARNLGIPAVVGAEFSDVQDGDAVVIDGDNGAVILRPAAEVLRKCEERRVHACAQSERLRGLIDLPAQTADGLRRIELVGNLCMPSDAEALVACGAEGIGLFRTEFLYMNRDTLPDEEEQFQAYRSVVQAMAPHPVTIRTLDIGGDKPVAGLDLPAEANPFLGWRAIRICLDRPEVFCTQLRAIVRASAFGKLRIMYPMITGLEELRQANEMLRAVMAELDRGGVSYDPMLESGIMIETPAAAALADVLASEADFCSIGTNDLIQYTLAVDRCNPRVAGLYDAFHPAVLHLIARTATACRNAGIKVGMCGELASDPHAVPLLLGLGLDELSVEPGALLKVKHAVRRTTDAQAGECAAQALKLTTCAEIKKLVESYIIPEI